MTKTKRKELGRLVVWLRLPDDKGRDEFWAVPASLKERWAALVEEVVAENDRLNEGRTDGEDTRAVDRQVEVDAGAYEA